VSDSTLDVGSHAVGTLTPARTAFARRVGGPAWRRRATALLLVMPMLLLTVGLFGIPLLQTIWYSASNPETAAALPTVSKEIGRWNGAGLPDDAVFDAMTRDLVAAAQAQTAFQLATRLNYELPGGRMLIMSAANRLPDALAGGAAPRAALLSINQGWGRAETWQVIRRIAQPVSAYYFLSAFDLRQLPSGKVVPVPSDRAMFVDIWLRTFWMSLVATVLALALGFPVAYFLANAPARWRGMLMIPVLLPFWVSLIARLCAWIVLLQKDGIINSFLMSIGLIDQPLPMLFNRFGTYVAMVHLLLPFVILPLYSVLQAIPDTYLKAASSLGARPVRGFLTAYLPQAVPGIAAAASLAFIISTGFYLTQMLVGGQREMMISNYIAFFATQTVNWGLSSALAVALIVVTTVLYLSSKLIFGGEGERP
jgi:putative spermidine/putrescine transport system permease protein